MNLEVCCGDSIDERAWIDPEVTGLCGISAAELEAMKNPATFTPSAEAVAQPTAPHPQNIRAERDPERYAALISLPDQVVWDKLSETTPPVRVGSIEPD